MNSRLRSAVAVPVAALVAAATFAILLPSARALFSGEDSCDAATCDLLPPGLSLTAPKSGQHPGNWVVVAGTASDNDRVSVIVVRLGDTTTSFPPSDNGSFSRILDTTFLPAGDHDLVVSAYDPAGNRAEQRATIVLGSAGSASAGSAGSPSTSELSGRIDPDLVPGTVHGPDDALAAPPVGRELLARNGVTGSISVDPGGAPWIRFADGAGGASLFRLPVVDPFGSAFTVAAWPADDHLFVASGGGPITVHHFRLNWTGGRPTGATLIETDEFGAPGSVVDDLVGLGSGAVVLAWHDAESSAPAASVRTGAGDWLPVDGLSPTATTEQVLAVQPVDGSVWLFGVHPDRGTIGVSRLVGDGEGLVVDTSDAAFFSVDRAFLYGPDTDAAHISVAADAAAGELVLAYQSADATEVESDAGSAFGSRLALASIGVDASVRFVHAPTHSLAGSRHAVVASGGTIGLVSRDAADPNRTWIRLFDGTTWIDDEVVDTAAAPLVSRTTPQVALHVSGSLRVIAL